MTERERVLSILNKKQPDVLPWCADLAYFIHGLQDDHKFPTQYENTLYDNGLQKMHRDLNVGFYLQGFFPFSTKTKNFTTEITTSGYNTIKTIKTPYGDLQEVTQYCPSSYSPAISQHLIKDIEDLKKYCYCLENTTYEPEYEFAQKRYETIGDNGIVLVYTPRSPFMQLMAVESGVENVTYMTLDDTDEFDELLKFMETKHDEAAKLAIDSPAECIMIPENISSECIGKEFYHKYMEGYHRKWTKYIKDKGKFSFVHLDGTVKGLVSELSQSGFDVVEAITPSPVGDLTIEEVRSLIKNDTIIWGGIPGGFFTDTISDEDFDRHVISIIKSMTLSPNHVLGVADQIVPNSTFERIKRVRELINQYGKY